MNYNKLIGLMNFGMGITIMSKEHGWPVALGALIMVVGALRLSEKEE
jgi:hypothetical protein